MCRLPIFIDQTQEALKWIAETWQSISSDNLKNEIGKHLIQKVCTCNYRDGL